MLSSFCQCWTRCLRDMVLTPSSTFQDAVQQWVWPRCKCAHTPGNLNGKKKNKQFIKTPKDKSIISETKVDSFQCSTLLFFSQVFVILITIRLTLFLNKAESRWRRRVQPSPFCLQWSWDLLSFRFAAEHTEQRSGRGTSCDISDNSEGSAKISLKFLCCFPHSRGLADAITAFGVPVSFSYPPLFPSTTIVRRMSTGRQTSWKMRHVCSKCTFFPTNIFISYTLNCHPHK